MSRKYSVEQHSECKKLYIEGLTFIQIGRKLSIPYQIIYYWSTKENWKDAKERADHDRKIANEDSIESRRERFQKENDRIKTRIKCAQLVHLLGPGEEAPAHWPRMSTKEISNLVASYKDIWAMDRIDLGLDKEAGDQIIVQVAFGNPQPAIGPGEHPNLLGPGGNGKVVTLIEGDGFKVMDGEKGDGGVPPEVEMHNEGGSVGVEVPIDVKAHVQHLIKGEDKATAT
jgi:hypothetical protein